MSLTEQHIATLLVLAAEGRKALGSRPMTDAERAAEDYLWERGWFCPHRDRNGTIRAAENEAEFGLNIYG